MINELSNLLINTCLRLLIAILRGISALVTLGGLSSTQLFNLFDWQSLILMAEVYIRLWVNRLLCGYDGIAFLFQQGLEILISFFGLSSRFVSNVALSTICCSLCSLTILFIIFLNLGCIVIIIIFNDALDIFGGHFSLNMLQIRVLLRYGISFSAFSFIREAVLLRSGLDDIIVSFGVWLNRGRSVNFEIYLFHVQIMLKWLLFSFSDNIRILRIYSA